MAHFVGDIGTLFRARLRDEFGEVIDLSTATGLTFLWRAPLSKLVKEFAATTTTDGLDGLCEYSTALATDIDERGEWQWQIRVEDGADVWHSSITAFEVEEVLQ